MKTRVLIVIVCVMAVVNVASADIVQDTDFVTIGHAGNASDSTGYGAVNYNYRIGKYEITNAQWNAFTTAAGVPTGNDGGYSYSAYFTDAQQPTNMVSWYEAAQFVNWLNTSGGHQAAYKFTGTQGQSDYAFTPWVVTDAGYDADNPYRNSNAFYFLPTEDEWYKAAYYTGSGYSLYANGTDIPPVPGVDTNYDHVIGQPWGIGVGNGTQEQNGTFDMMGNIWEWNETLIDSYRVLRGSSYQSAAYYGGVSTPSSSFRIIDHSPDIESDTIGFRIASVPEPATLLLLGLGGSALRKRRAE